MTAELKRIGFEHFIYVSGGAEATITATGKCLECKAAKLGLCQGMPTIVPYARINVTISSRSNHDEIEAKLQEVKKKASCLIK